MEVFVRSELRNNDVILHLRTNANYSREFPVKVQGICLVCPSCREKAKRGNYQFDFRRANEEDRQRIEEIAKLDVGLFTGRGEYATIIDEVNPSTLNLEER